MDLYSTYLKTLHDSLASFTDPFSQTVISTDRLSYPITYLTSEQLRPISISDSLQDRDDDQLIELSLQQDLPRLEYTSTSHPYITDASAHILNNRNRDRFVIILGMPKIGKSWLLKKLALLAVQQARQDSAHPVPLLVPLKSICKFELNSKMDFIEACLGLYEEYEALLRGMLFQGKLMLLLDGLEDTGNIKERVLEWIKATLNFIPVPLCVLTSRFNGYIECSNAVVTRMELYPMKLQLCLAQEILSEMQYDKFADAITGTHPHFGEFASSPYLLSLLLDLFRCRLIGIDNFISRGKLYSLSMKHLLESSGRRVSPVVMKILEKLAFDMLARDMKDFSLLDVQRLGGGNYWNEIQSLPFFIKHELSQEISRISASNLGYDDESLRISVEAGIGEIKESIQLKLIREEEITGNFDKFNRELTPTVSSARDVFKTYQVARSFIKPGKEKSIHPAESIEIYRFIHLRFQELLATQHLLNTINDTILQSSGAFLMETAAFNKIFSTCLGNNILYCRGYREVLMLAASLCNNNVFENLLKYLFNTGNIESCHLAERMLKERSNSGQYRPYVNKLKQLKIELLKKLFLKGFSHPSSALRRLAQGDLIEAGISDAEMKGLVLRRYEKILKKKDWTYIRELNEWSKDISISLIRRITARLIEICTETLYKYSKKHSYNPILLNTLCNIFINSLEKPIENTQTPGTSVYAPPNTLNTTPFKPDSNTIERYTESESTLRISCERFNIHEPDYAIQEILGSSLPKLQNALLDILQACPAVDIYPIVKILLILKCSLCQLHTSLLSRFTVLTNKEDKIGVLNILKEMRFLSQYTIMIPLMLLDEDDREMAAQAKSILVTLNTTQLKIHAVNLLVKEDASTQKIMLAIKIMRYSSRSELDDDVIHLLVNFIDHHNLDLRLEALTSLYKLLKSFCKPVRSIRRILQNVQIRKMLAAAPHILADRLKLSKYPIELRSISLKCVTILWVALDRDQEDKYTWDMAHILVKESLGSSYIVGSLKSMLLLLNSQLRYPEMKKEVWECLLDMEPLSLQDNEVKEDLWNMMERGMNDSSEDIKLIALKMLRSTSVSNIPVNRFKETLAKMLLSSCSKVVKHSSKLMYRWNELELIRQKFPVVLTSGISNVTHDLFRILNNFQIVLSCLDTEMSSLCLDIYNTRESYKLQQQKALHNQYKLLINYIAENLSSPFLPCKDTGKTEFLEISADPSFFKDDSGLDFSISFTELDENVHSIPPKHISMESANTEVEEHPPDVYLCHFLLKAGVRTDSLIRWVFWYLKKRDLKPWEYLMASEAYMMVNTYYGVIKSYVKEAIHALIRVCPETAARAVLNLKFVSDEIAKALLNAMFEGRLVSPSSHQAIATCIEISNLDILTQLHNALQFTHPTDSRLIKIVQSQSILIFERMQISKDDQLCNCIQYLSQHKCPILFTTIWSYLKSKLTENPNYRLSDISQSYLETSKTWEGAYLLSWCRILGLMTSETYIEDCSSQSTKHSSKR
jgi:hypothetical protein